ncbi:Uncharacterized protein TCM_021235 [Theobroma cacao]|uniref:Uncharacterized protein n=1 Tax=Theobroma cacao TaxID=3641 RepID=A0A061EWA5_THECC|nr:Uncharacterized protein TCM_021235 [Theobroma cacao]
MGTKKEVPKSCGLKRCICACPMVHKLMFCSNNSVPGQQLFSCLLAILNFIKFLRLIMTFRDISRPAPHPPLPPPPKIKTQAGFT